MALLSDCHRRIERFLSILQRVCRESHGGPLDASHREALEVALRYFSTAAPRHTADEESSLFPRMRALRDDRVAAMLAEMARLEADHAMAVRLHDEVDELGRRWLADGSISADQTARLGELLESLVTIYERHIAYEDRVVFPTASEVLSPSDIAAVGQEMAQRRGLDPSQKPVGLNLPKNTLDPLASKPSQSKP